MPEPTAAPLPRNTEFRLQKSQELCLDLIRILMAQFIVLGHLLVLADTNSWWSKLPLPGLRVSVFFMLSGFLIFATTWRRRDQDYSFRDFLIERTARLWVCLVPALAFSALVASLVLDLPDYPATPHAGPIHFIGNLLMLEDYPLFQILRRLGVDSIFFVRPYAAAEPYWTLPIEFWLYVVFGYLFFYGYLRRGRPSWGTQALTAVALFAVVYHAATGYGQCLSLFWVIGALGPWAVDADRKLQRRFGLSDKRTLGLIAAWIGLCVALIVLRGLSRKLDFYAFQLGLFLAGLLIGLVWLTGRINIDFSPLLSSVARSIAKQTYALYLTHNAVLTYYISLYGAKLTLWEGLGLVVACNVVAVPFYWLFDRHHKVVARWARSLQWPAWLLRPGRSTVS
jgi:peptidoglycan/LPS O-acetylase OafA/YrhL